MNSQGIETAKGPFKLLEQARKNVADTIEEIEGTISPSREKQLRVRLVQYQRDVHGLAHSVAWTW